MKPERVIVWGGRDFDDEPLVRAVLTHLIEQCGDGWPVIVHGDSRGADRLAARVARELGCDTEAHPADWGRHGRSAGWVRNSRMAQAGAVLCVAFPGGRGTASMVEIAREAGIRVLEVAPGALQAMEAA